LFKNSKKTAALGGFIVEILPIFKEAILLILLMLFQKIEEKELLPNSFCETSVILKVRLFTISQKP
jgi:hypothetical protein